ncbi:cupredoxin domain-containing protein [Candidatus Gottesmanbacteria bacterium]|nr:cupredoxin domain-containing protein [Candidatus Gottesmanbacteria bacterium]
MDKLIVTISGILSLGGIYWFFFGKKEEAMEVTDAITIIVEGGYKPNNIKINNGQPTTLTFLRKDSNPCLEEIVFPDFKIKKFLPVGESIPITITPTKTGIFGFHCGMNMFHGRLEII